MDHLYEQIEEQKSRISELEGENERLKEEIQDQIRFQSAYDKASYAEISRLKSELEAYRNPTRAMKSRAIALCGLESEEQFMKIWNAALSGLPETAQDIRAKK